VSEEGAFTLAAPTVIGRYVVYGEIARGGMATVHYGRMVGEVGFSRTVAIKRLHHHLAKDPEFVTMFLDEARVAARIRHPNVVPTLDVVSTEGQLLLVMEYVAGEPLARLLRASSARGERIPLPIVSSILINVLHGLHSAHEAVNEKGEALQIVHRDVSPQNVMVGVDGVARVLDFGVAKAAGRLHTTQEGKLKGKIAYMPPEQVRGSVTRASDIYAVSAVLWETLVGRRMIKGTDDVQVLEQVLFGEIEPPSRHVPGLPPVFDEIVMRGLSRDPAKRFATAREMARELESRTSVASASAVGECVEALARDALTERARVVGAIESRSGVLPGDPVSEIIARLGPVGPVEARPAPVPDQRSFPVDGSTISGSRAFSPPARGGWRGAIGAVVLVVLFGVGLVLFARPAPPPQSAVTAAFGTPAAIPPEPVKAVTPEPASPATGTGAPLDDPPEVELDAPDPSAKLAGVHPSAVRPGASRSAPSARAGGGPATPSRPASTGAHTPCNPPFVVDPDGTKHFKLECL
jgi:serine/threonine protein kinase